jgi:hypothetical protein
MGKTAAVQVSDQQRDLRPAGTVSSSLLTATTADGAYSLQQALTFTPAGELDQVTLNEAIPLASGDSVGTTVHHTSTTSALLTDGSIQVQTTGTASPLGDVNGVTAPTRTVMVTIVLAADRVQVVQEKVTIAPAPAPAPAPLPTATPESTPTSGSGTPDAPAPDPTLPPDPSGSAVGAPGLPVVVEDPTAR